jgi:hypothetical protein
MYRPIGLDWFKEGFWKVWDQEATAQQYLSLELTTEWETLREIWLNTGNRMTPGGIYHIPDPHHGATYKGMLLQSAKDFKFDLVVSTMPQHFEPFERFRQRYCPRAKHVFQMGNMWGVPGGCKNVLNSTSSETPGVHAVNYHQEFSLEEFHPGPCSQPESVANLMHYQHHHCLEDFNAVKSRLTAWRWMNYGAGNEHGATVSGKHADAIRDVGFVFHCKRGGEGYGYNIHYAFACGRPMIVKRGLYEGMVSAPLFTDDTCVDIDALGHDGAAGKMVHIVNNWPQYSENVRRRFDAVVNFDEEFIRIKSFLENLR